jgi:predicted Zn-dependent protease
MRMRNSISILSTLCFILAMSLAASAQATPTSTRPAGVGSATEGVPTRGTGGGGASLKLSVVDENNARLDRQAVVKLYDETMKHPTWQPTSKDSDTIFDSLGVGKYDLEVSALGFLTARKDFEIVGKRQLDPTKLTIVLHPDPDAIELTGADTSMNPKASKEAEKGLSDMKLGKLPDAQKHLESANKESPTSAYPNFLLGYLYFEQNKLPQAQDYLAKATTIDPHDVQALNLLGRLHLSQHDFAGAKTVASQAIAVSADNATAHGILADAYLNQGDFKNALDEADIALTKGKSPASSAQIVKGQALANLGRDDEAIQALKTYLQSAPDTAAGPQVQQFMAAVEQRRAASTPSTTPPPAKQ